MTEFANFIHSIARGKWPDVTPEWSLQQVHQGLVIYQGVSLEDFQRSVWRYSPRTLLRSVYIGRNKENKTLYFWVERYPSEPGYYPWEKPKPKSDWRATYTPWKSDV